MVAKLSKPTSSSSNSLPSFVSTLRVSSPQSYLVFDRRDESEMTNERSRARDAETEMRDAQIRNLSKPVSDRTTPLKNQRRTCGCPCGAHPAYSRRQTVGFRRSDAHRWTISSHSLPIAQKTHMPKSKRVNSHHIHIRCVLQYGWMDGWDALGSSTAQTDAPPSHPGRKPHDPCSKRCRFQEWAVEAKGEGVIDAASTDCGEHRSRDTWIEGQSYG